MKIIGKLLSPHFLLFGIAIQLLAKGVVFAAVTTTPGNVTLLSTFECISVRAKYSGDDNANNFASIQWRELGGTWKNAYTPFIDRRSVVGRGSNDNSANQFEARGSIVGLQPDKEYEIRVTWGDPDDLAGAQPAIATIKTLSLTAPSNGMTLWVNAKAALGGDGSQTRPFRTIPEALNAAQAGDTIHILPGSYPSFTVAKSGNPNGYITLEGESPQTVRIRGGSVDYNIAVRGDYLRIKNFTFEQARDSSIRIEGHHHIFVEDTIHENISFVGRYGSSGVELRGTFHNIYIFRNRFSTTFNDNVYGVYFRGTSQGTVVIADNHIEGTFRDGIGGQGNSGLSNGPFENSDIARNFIKGPVDDGLECEGGNINVRIWGNVIDDGRAHPAMGLAPTVAGPLYLFRNVIKGIQPGGAFKLGNGGEGPMYVFHNTIDVTGDGANESGGTPWTENDLYLNNIFRTQRYTLYRQGRSNRYDYNLHLRVGDGVMIDEWNGSQQFDCISGCSRSFQSTGHGLHSLGGDPLFINGNKEIDANSPAHDSGVIIPNFNDANSAWPYRGNAPDMGAFEVPGSSPTLNAPKSLRIVP